MRKLLACCCCCLFCSYSYSKDLGVHGRLYPIKEMDMRLRMIMETAKVDWSVYNDELKESAKNYSQSLPSFYLKHSLVNKTKFIDPSITLNRDIIAPIKNTNGKWKWGVLHKEGTTTNILDKLKPNTNLFFFSGKNKAQLKLIKAVISKFNEKIMPIMVEGDPTKLSKELNLPVYYATQDLIDGFEIKYIPTMVGVGKEGFENNYAVTRFSYPYDLQLIENAWNGLDYE